MPYYFTYHNRTSTRVQFSRGSCYIRTKEVHGPYDTKQDLIKALEPLVEKEVGRSDLFEIFVSERPLRFVSESPL